MSTTRSPHEVLDAELLTLRAKLLEAAAILDRVERATGPAADAATMATIRSAVETLLRSDANRAEQIQLLFSRTYDERWRETLEI